MGAKSSAEGLRLGLCCTFAETPIRFRKTTATYLLRLREAERRTFLRQLVADNVRALDAAVAWCAAAGIGAFRITSQFFPVATHPEVGYRLEAIDPGGESVGALRAVGARARRAGLRLSLHPDPFVVPGSAREDVAAQSLAELEFQAEFASWVGVEQLTIHGGGGQGGKEAALGRLARAIERASPRLRSRLVLENDDRLYTMQDLLPLCEALELPLVYDVHHHRCLPDGLDVTEATEAAAATWKGREPWAHVSSPRDGWLSGKPRLHAECIDPDDFPSEWLGRRMTVDVEAKGKERAVFALARHLGLPVGPPELSPAPGGETAPRPS